MLCLVALGCGDNTGNVDGGQDLTAALDGAQDLTGGGGGDMAGLMCSMTDPMADTQDCTSNGFVCPGGQICVRDNGAATYHCKYKCSDSSGNIIPALCPCDRACLTLTDVDGGVVGGGCIPGNTAAQRCGYNAGTPIFGNGACAQQTFCAGPMNGNAYCLWTCTVGGNECPAATTCSPLTDGMGNQIGLACTYNYPDPGVMGGIAGGSACTALTDVCQTGYLCDGAVCQKQCNGPGDNGTGKTCTTGTCTAVNDPAKSKIIGYVCK
jgi:hypothetical protein